MSHIPIIGQKPQLPPTVLSGGWVPGAGRVWLQFGPVGTLEIEEAERIVAGLTAAIERAKVERAALAAAVQANGTGGGHPV